MRNRHFVRPLKLGALALIGWAGFAGADPSHSPLGAARYFARSASSVVCTGAIQHPVSVRVEALDPIQRGSTIRLRVVTTSRVSAARAAARLTSAGGARVIGRDRVPLGRLGASMPSAAEFQVSLPSEGHRFLVQFQVEGEGATGPWSRGATFNLLPDGPAEIGRIVTTSAGQRIAEVPARRIER